MARDDMERILGALIGGAASGGLRPSRRRRRVPPPLIDVRVGGTRSATRTLASLAAAVLGSVLSGTGSGSMPPQPSRQGRDEPLDTVQRIPPPPAPPGKAPQNPWAAPAPPRGTISRPAPEPREAEDAEDAEALLILRAMISCARADGSLDADERAAIATQLDKAGLDQQARDLVLAEFARPAAVAEIAREVGDPVLAAQVYAAAYLAAGELGPAERAWLDAFATATRLDPNAVRSIEERLSEG